MPSRALPPPETRPASIRPSAWRAPLVLALLVGAWVATYGVACTVKWRYFLYDDIDLAIFAQAAENLLRGSLASSIRGMPWLGDHSSLVMFLLVPVQALFRHPLALPWVQTLALGLGALPVFALARRTTRHDGLALACAALYLMQPALGYLDLFEFHPEVLSTSCLLAAIHFLWAGRLRPMAVWAALALLGKEDVALVVLALALAALALRRPRHAAALAALAAGSLALSFGVLKPLLGGPQAEYGRMYAAWGSTPPEVARALLTRPLEVARALTGLGVPGALGEATRQLHVHLLLPLAFLPLLAPEVMLLALPALAEHLLSDRMPQHTIVYQYSALVVPFYTAAAVIGLGRLVRLVARMPAGGDLAVRLAGDPAARALAARLAMLVLVPAALANLMFGPLTGQGVLQSRRALQPVAPSETDRARAPVLRAMIARLPAEGGVVAGFGVLPHLARRPRLESLHHLVGGRWTYSTRAYPAPHDITALVGDLASPRMLAYVDGGTGARMRALIGRERLAPAATWGDLVLLVRDAEPVALLADDPSAYAQRPGIDLVPGLAWLGSGRAPAPVTPGGVLEFHTVWMRRGALEGPTPMEWVVRDAAGRVTLEHPRYLGYLIAPPCDWSPGVAMRETYRLPLPATIAEGTYTLGMRVGVARAGRPEMSAEAPVQQVMRFVVAGAAGAARR